MRPKRPSQQSLVINNQNPIKVIQMSLKDFKKKDISAALVSIQRKSKLQKAQIY